MQSDKERERKNKCTNAEGKDTRRSTHIQLPRGNNKQQRQSNWPYSWNRKEGERCYWQYNCRNRKKKSSKESNASNMADGRCHHHTHNDICMWKVDNQQGRKQKSPMHIQRSIKNPTIPTQRNPHNDPPQWNRQNTNKIYHQDKENLTSHQTHRPNERRIPNKGCHASQSKHAEEICNRPRKGTPYLRSNDYPEQGGTKTLHPKRNRNKNFGRNIQWSRNKTKIYHWKERKKEIKVETRPKYMDKLNRKQINAIPRARSSMLMVKEKYKKQYESNLLCRFCGKYSETQEHILQDYTKIKGTKGKIVYNKIFEEATEPLKEIADEIIKIEECLKEQQLHSMSSSNWSEPPAWHGRMHRYYYYGWLRHSQRHGFESLWHNNWCQKVPVVPANWLYCTFPAWNF